MKIKVYLVFLLFMFIFQFCSKDGSNLIDENGDIKSSVAKKYFAKINNYMFSDELIDKSNILPADIENKFIQSLPLKNYSNYIINIKAKNYYVSQNIPEENIYEICVPKIMDTEEGRLIWKNGLNFILKIDSNNNIEFTLFHEVIMSKLLKFGDYYQYISVDSSLGGNYTEIHLIYFHKNNFTEPVVNETIYSSGSFVPTTILNWTLKNNILTLDGFSDDNKSKIFKKLRKEIMLTASSSN